MTPTALAPGTTAAIRRIFRSLDYSVLGPVYCDVGGDAFWRATKTRCRRLGIQMAAVLRARLPPRGRSLYVGAGVAELPLLAMETMELHRTVEAYNLRHIEVEAVNGVCRGVAFELRHGDAARARGRFDHLCIVSVLNDPERFPELSALSYGRADPVTFNTAAFVRQRRQVRALANACLTKLRRPALITTSVEEVGWLVECCARGRARYTVEEPRYPTAIVGDPLCIIRIG